MNVFTLLRGKFGRNVGSTLLTQALTWTMAMGVTFFLPGYLGEKNLGVLTLAAGFAGTLSVFVNFGTSTVLVREIARTPERVGELVRAALILRLTLGLLVLSLGAGVTFLLGYADNVRLVIIIALISSVAGHITEPFQSALRGLEEFPKQNAAVLAEKIVFSACTVGLVYVKAPLWSFVAVYLFGTAISAAFAWRKLLPFLQAKKEIAIGPPPMSRYAECRNLAVAGLPFLSSMVFVSIYGDGSSALLMSKLSTLEAIGWFGLAKRFAGAAQMVPVAVAGAMLPILTRLYHSGDRDGYAQMVRSMICVLLACLVPLSLVLIVFPEILLHLLHYPEGFAGSVPVLRLTGCVLVLWFAQQAVGTALVAAGKQAIFGKVTAVAALLAFPVCGVCIWAGERFMRNGAFGAMAADAILEIFLLSCYTRVLLPELTSPKSSGPATRSSRSELTEAI
ncbi:MAG: oligosaccharide flippase family protein [Akkermansiaceae bacterium]|nr:oligosaccharide flippase family protein [Armatimonadota bacterium]